MSDQQPPSPKHKFVDEADSGISRTVAATGNLVVSLDKDKVVGLVYVTKVTQPDGSSRVAHGVDVQSNVDRKNFCLALAEALTREAAVL